MLLFWTVAQVVYHQTVARVNYHRTVARVNYLHLALMELLMFDSSSPDADQQRCFGKGEYDGGPVWKASMYIGAGFRVDRNGSRLPV